MTYLTDDDWKGTSVPFAEVPSQGGILYRLWHYREAVKLTLWWGRVRYPQFLAKNPDRAARSRTAAEVTAAVLLVFFLSGTFAGLSIATATIIPPVVVMIVNFVVSFLVSYNYFAPDSQFRKRFVDAVDAIAEGFALRGCALSPGFTLNLDARDVALEEAVRECPGNSHLIAAGRESLHETMSDDTIVGVSARRFFSILPRQLALVIPNETIDEYCDYIDSYDPASGADPVKPNDSRETDNDTL